MRIRILRDLPAFVGFSGVYGPYRAGDVVTVSDSIFLVLLNRGWAEEINESSASQSSLERWF